MWIVGLQKRDLNIKKKKNSWAFTSLWHPAKRAAWMSNPSVALSHHLLSATFAAAEFSLPKATRSVQFHPPNNHSLHRRRVQGLWGHSRGRSGTCALVDGYLWQDTAPPLGELDIPRCSGREIHSKWRVISYNNKTSYVWLGQQHGKD